MLLPLHEARPGVGIAWWAGGGAYALASSAGVRLNFRGARLLPPSARLRELGALGWTRAACNQSAHALCCADLGCVLPAAPPRVPDEGGGLVPERLCADSGGKVLVSAAVYDVSACDLLDEGLDVVYSAGEVYLRRTDMPLWRYWLCVGLAIVLVRGLSFNLRTLWQPPNNNSKQEHPAAPPPRQWLPLVAALALIALVVPFDAWDAVYATHADQTFHWATVMYVPSILLLNVATRRGAPVFNVIVAALQLLAMRLYTSATTPYDVVFVAMLAWRAWVKVLTPALHGLGLALDSLYLSLFITLACDETLETLVAVVGAPFAAARLLTARY